jgi:hypothetical protein
MSIFPMMFSGWNRVRAAFRVSDQPTLLESVCDAYRMEANAVAQCTRHADQMHYPQFRTALLRIAAEVQAHLPWLHEQIGALGGSLPSSAPLPTPEGNSWECLRRAVEEAQRGCVRLLEWSHLVEREAPALAMGLQRIRTDKLRQREEFRAMWMKSDPYTISTMESPHDQDEDLKHAWLEQRKNAWLDHGRAAWRAGGKQTVWAEWVGEQEFRWIAELPNRDLEWVRTLAEQGDIGRRQTIPKGDHGGRSPSLLSTAVDGLNNALPS